MNIGQTGDSRSLAPVCRAIFAVAALLLAIVYGFSWAAPSVGLFHDDGVYVVTAKALAEGRGYRIISLPEEIPQTKYPFLLPAALSVLWRMMPDFPRNAPLLKALPVACALIWFWLAYRLLIRLRATRIQAAWMVLLTAAAPQVIYFATNPMSETMFAALFTAALLAAHSVETSDSGRLAWVAGALAALAFLTRTAGVALLIAIPFAFAVQRRFGAAWRFLITGWGLASLWPVWVYTHAGASNPAQLYYASGIYSSWNIVSNYALPQKLDVLTFNVLLSLISPASLLDLPAPAWLLLVGPGLLIALAMKKRIRAGAVPLSAAAYMGIIVCWAWPPPRFIAIVFPLILLFMWKAIDAIAPRRLRHAIVAVLIPASCLVLVNDIRRIPLTIASGHFPADLRQSSDEWPEMEKVFAWLRNNTKPDDVVLTNLDPAFYLYTGRKSTRSVVAESYKVFYASGTLREQSLMPVDDVIRITRASFLVMTPDRWFAEMPVLRNGLARYMESHPGKLEPVERPGAGPEYQVYRIRR